MAHTPGQPYQPGQMMAAKPSSGLAIAAMVCGIVSIPLMCIPYLNVLTIPCSITAVVMGLIANGKATRGEAGGKGMAVAGIVCGSITLAIILVVIILAVVVGASIFGFMKAAVDEAQKKQQQQQNQGSMIEPLLQSTQICLVYAKGIIAMIT